MLCYRIEVLAGLKDAIEVQQVSGKHTRAWSKGAVRMNSSVSIGALCLVLAGCYGFTPSATRKEVSPSDIIGTWQFAAHPRVTGPEQTPINDGVITIRFKGDGTFEETVVKPGIDEPLTQSGTWKLDGTELALEGVLLKETSGVPWESTTAHWSIIDSFERRGEVAIHGGCFDDPDGWREFKKLGP